MIRIEEELVVNNKTIDARILSRMFLAGAKNLEAKKEWINELNVFPVPDGDTGTNISSIQKQQQQMKKFNLVKQNMLQSQQKIKVGIKF